MRVPVVYTRLLFALATAYRLLCAQEATGGEPVRDLVIVFAQGYDGIFHMAEDLLQVGVSIKDRPPGIGTRQEVLAPYGLMPKA